MSIHRFKENLLKNLKSKKGAIGPLIFSQLGLASCYSMELNEVWDDTRNVPLEKGNYSACVSHVQSAFPGARFTPSGPNSEVYVVEFSDPNGFGELLHLKDGAVEMLVSGPPRISAEEKAAAEVELARFVEAAKSGC